MEQKRLFLSILLVMALAVWLSPAAAGAPRQAAQDGQALFQQKCAACHTIGGGKLVGPDLQGVVQRRDLGWLRSFIAAPDKMIAAGDPLAQQLLAENNQVPMPNLGLSTADVDALMAYLENPGQAGAAPAAPGVVLPAGGVDAGRRLFTGETFLSSGGPACLACHSVEGISALGGGSLGPDLTYVLTRYGDAGLAANLNQITFPTMIGPFLNKPLSPQEQADLIAYFQSTNTQPPAAASISPGSLFLGSGAGLALLLFAAMFIFRPRRASSPLDRLLRKR
jgi:mono/diheme cytochrome c family protein